MKPSDIKNDPEYDFLIAGAGLYGAVMARELCDMGFRVLVAEKRDHAGGSVCTDVSSGIVVHKCGPHIFHTDNTAVWEYVNGFARFIPFYNRPAAVYRKERYSLPVDMNTFEELFGVTEPEEARRIVEKQIRAAGLYGAEAGSLEEQAIKQAGTDIYEKLIKGYSEKQWGRPCSELPASIIKRFSVRYDRGGSYYSDRYQGVPAEGYSPMISRLLEGVEMISGCDLSDPYLRAELSAKARMTVYSGSIDSYFGYCLGRLGYRSVRFEEEIIGGVRTFQDRAVVNYTGAEVPFTRVTEHKYFSADPDLMEREMTIISREYPEEYNGSNEPLYPLRDASELRLYESYRHMAEADGNIFFGGRLGSYKYMDMDETVESALSDSKLLSKRFAEI